MVKKVEPPSMLSETINRLFYDPSGQIVISLIFGLSLALLFRRVCVDNCIAYFAPNVQEIQGKTFKIEESCYKYTPYAVKCDTKETIYSGYDVNTKPDNQIIDYGLFSRMFS